MKGFLTGLGIGVGLGVLFAPERGEATRDKVRERVSGWSGTVAQKLERVKDGIEEQATAFSESMSKNRDQTNIDFPAKKDRASGGISTESSTDPINTLSREELLNVNGIGSALADKIISNRPYSSRQELVQRGILPQSTFDQLEQELLRKRSA
jgi:DNA uptake protein ComE-like DNA-binding protein